MMDLGDGSVFDNQCMERAARNQQLARRDAEIKRLNGKLAVATADLIAAIKALREV